MCYTMLFTMGYNLIQVSPSEGTLKEKNMLVIAYVVLAFVSYLAVQLALSVSVWLVILFTATFAYSIVGFAQSMAKLSRKGK